MIAAESYTSAAAALGYDPLQWSRCVIAAESGSCFRLDRDRSPASMEPLRDRSGEAQSTCRHAPDLYLASMEPLRDRSGEREGPRHANGERGRFNGAAA